MSEPGSARDSSPLSNFPDDPPTPPNQTDLGPFSTPVSDATAEGPLNGYRVTANSRNDLKAEIRKFTITNPDSNWVQRILLHNRILNEKADTILKVLTDSNLYDSKKERWVVIPAEPSEEDDLYDPYTTLLKAIIDSLPTVEGSRKVKVNPKGAQTHQESHRPSEQGKRVASKPDVLIVGYDPTFLPNRLEVPLSSEFERAISVGDIKRERSREGKEDIFSQVAMYAR